MIPGRGVAAKVEGYHVLAGNRAMLNENNIKECIRKIWVLTDTDDYLLTRKVLIF